MPFEQKDLLAGFRSIVRCEDALARAGYKVMTTDDFVDVSRRLAECGRANQAPMSDVRRNDFTKGRAFWLFVERDGLTVAGIGASFVDLGGERFSEYLFRTSQSQYDRSTQPIAGIKRVVDQLQGRLVYVSDLTSGLSARKTSSVVRPMLSMLQLVALDRWLFDWMYAFIPREKAKIGSTAQFFLKVDGALTWNKPVPIGRKDSHILIATTPDHIADSQITRAV